MAILFRSWDPVLDVILRIMPVGGGEPRDLHKFGGATSVGHIAWTPDGKSILAAVTIGEKNTGSLWRVSADSGEAENLGLEMTIKRMSIHPDGRQLAFSSPGPAPQKPELWVMENFLPPGAPAPPREDPKRVPGPQGLGQSSRSATSMGAASPDGKIPDLLGRLSQPGIRDLVKGQNRLPSAEQVLGRREYCYNSIFSPGGARSPISARSRTGSPN